VAISNSKKVGHGRYGPFFILFGFAQHIVDGRPACKTPAFGNVVVPCRRQLP